MKPFFKILGICYLLFLTACTIPQSKEYQSFYAHLRTFQAPSCPMQEEDYFLIILVDACHLDYTDTCRFFQSVAIHPNGSRRGDVGHAWIYLQGKGANGHTFVLEGGHSGERITPPARYFDGIMNYNDWGYANPTAQQMCNPRYEPNPIKYLWTIREDGFFQKGSGGHYPTFAAKISLSRQQFERILAFIRPRHYPYHYYALMGPQCCKFVAQVAALAGLSLSTEMKMRIAPSVYYRKVWIRLWEDPQYSIVTFSTPDIVEKSLIQAIENGEAEYALDWYLQNRCYRFQAVGRGKKTQNSGWKELVNDEQEELVGRNG